MDTKWKNRKKGISFLIFVLGVSLTLGSLVNLLKAKPSRVRIWQVNKLLEEDYQESARFRAYITDRLENLLIMATGGEGLWGIWGYNDGTYYGDDFDGSYYRGEYLDDGRPGLSFLEEVEFSTKTGDSSLSVQELTGYVENLEAMQEGYLELLNAMNELEDTDRENWRAFQSELETYQEEMQNQLAYIKAYLPDSPEQQIKPLTEEQKQKIAQKYHDSIKGDKNLLYTVLYDGKVLYSNGELLGDTAPEGGDSLSTAYGHVTLPEGYNFLLYFDGEKARILKDGAEMDIYGDGYYRDDNDWYLPGYTNFQVDDTVKKAAVCIAVAKDPVLYTEGSYQKGNAMQYDNSLYWMNQNLQGRREGILRSFMGLAAGILLLFVAFLCRKGCRETREGIARFQAKIWLECKILLLLLLFYGLYMSAIVFVTNGSGWELWEEAFYAYDYNYSMDAALWFGRELGAAIPSVFWIVVFWGLWLLWNDLGHNKKIWRCSLTARLYRIFSGKKISQPLSRRMFCRSRNVFLISLVYGVLMLEGCVLVNMFWQEWNVRAAILLISALETILFLAMQSYVGTKNVKVARDVEALSHRIAQIRNGDYSAGAEIGDHPETDSEDGEEREQKELDITGCKGQALEEDRNIRIGIAPSHSDLEAVMAQLEDIRHGMAKAVEEQMKSERMKVELIANVSHDIKTPLTSIISYVEILKQEEGLPDYVKDYIKILDEKSQRLKNMVQDVFAVSKAASGELPMEMEELDFGKLLRQTLADMEEEIENSHITFRTEIPETPVLILADGQRLYRVFQNLFQNACKYSLQGSRVYVALKADGQLAIASVKNISSQELEKGRDFTGRFTRGDQSRTDGGSGLGLSIAKSFTEACGGEFAWETNADLFIVKVTFKTLPNKASAE